MWLELVVEYYLSSILQIKTAVVCRLVGCKCEKNTNTLFLLVIYGLFGQIPGVAVTCDLEAIMDGYYRVLFPLNPGSIRPAVPRSSQRDALLQPHDRERLSKVPSYSEYTVFLKNRLP